MEDTDGNKLASSRQHPRLSETELPRLEYLNMSGWPTVNDALTVMNYMTTFYIGLQMKQSTTSWLGMKTAAADLEALKRICKDVGEYLDILSLQEKARIEAKDPSFIPMMQGRLRAIHSLSRKYQARLYTASWAEKQGWKGELKALTAEALTAAERLQRDLKTTTVKLLEEDEEDETIDVDMPSTPTLPQLPRSSTLSTLVDEIRVFSIPGSLEVVA